MRFFIISLLSCAIPFLSCAQKELKTADIMNEEYVQKALHMYDESLVMKGHYDDNKPERGLLDG